MNNTLSLQSKKTITPDDEITALMKITRKMLHKDLQPFSIYGMLKFLGLLCTRQWTAELAQKLLTASFSSETPDSVSFEEKFLPSTDGEASIRVKIYRPANTTASDEKLPPMLYTHGGEYIMGSPDAVDADLAKYVECRHCVIVAPAYRTAFIKPYPAAFDDCYMTLLWMRDNGDELGIDTTKFMIAGHSAGGGLTAAVTLKARDTKDVNVAFQMPFYPMIDDQQPYDSARSIDVVGWNSKTNKFGWESYLKDLHERNAEIPTYAAAARNTDYNNFPPTITSVGEYEAFYWETLTYVESLKKAGIEVAFKEFKGATHAPDFSVPDTQLAQDFRDFEFECFADFYDRYITS